MKIMGRTQMLSHKLSVDEMLRFYKDAGFDGVEICFEDINFNLRPDLLEDYIIDHTRELAGELGLEISAVGNHMRYFYDDFIYEYLKKSIPKANRYGTDVFIISSMINPEQKIYQKDLWEFTVERIRGLAEIAEANGVRLAIEPEPPAAITSTEDFLRLAEDIGSGSIACNFDIGHAFLTDEDIYKSIEKLGKRICHCHVDNMTRGQHLHLLPHLGEIDLVAVFRKLKSIGFDGGMSLDMYNYRYDEAAPGAVATLHDMLSKI
jgi:sugar phosphate isomerase/epimerase